MYSPRDLVKEYLMFKYPIKLQGYKTSSILSEKIIWFKYPIKLQGYKTGTKRPNSKENNEATLMGGFFIAKFVYPIKNIIPFSCILVV